MAKSTGLPQLSPVDAHGALELRRQRAERHHAELHGLVLDFAREAAEPRQVAVEVADRAGDAGADRRDVARRLGELAGQQMEFGVAIELELVEAVAAADRGVRRRPAPTIARLPAERAHFVVGLELVRHAPQPRGAELQLVDLLDERRVVLLERRAVDDQLARRRARAR